MRAEEAPFASGLRLLGGFFAKLFFALHEVTSETESRARLVKNEACDPKHLGDFVHGLLGGRSTLH